MIITAGCPPTAATDLDAAVAAFQPMVEGARRTNECIDLHVSADHQDAEFLEIHVDLFRTERA